MHVVLSHHVCCYFIYSRENQCYSNIVLIQERAKLWITEMPLWTVMLSERAGIWCEGHLTSQSMLFTPVVSTTVTGITVDSKTFWKTSHVLFNFELPYIVLDSLWMFAKFNSQFWNTEHHRQAFNSKENNSKVSACVKQSNGLLSS